MGKYSIKELERLSGIKAHTLRIWEKRYSLFSPNRTETNIRYYSDEDLKKLLSVSLLSNSGKKISKIVAMKDDELRDAIKEIEDTTLLNQKRVDDLIFPMINFDEPTFNQLFNQYVNEIGVEKTFTDILYPFLEKVGILWLSDEVQPTQEHFTSHLIRQKLSAIIEALPAPKKNAKKVILFLPEGEYHELGLLFFAYLYKKKGVSVFYLGQSVPLHQVNEVSKLIRPNWILSYSIVKPKAAIEKMTQLMANFQADQVFFLENKL